MSNSVCHTMSAIIVLLMCNKIITVDIIIDLGNTLIKTKKLPIASKIGMFNLMGHTLTHWKSPRKDFYKFLESVKAPHDKIVAYDENHRKLPCIMNDWLKGVPSKKILKKVAKAQPSKFNWKLAQIVFDPKIVSKSTKLIKKGVQFVHECRAEGHNVYILANQSAEAFELIKAQYPDFFKLFSGIIISGTCALAKPDPAIFNHLLVTYNLDPENCFFIDDQLENIASANQLGLATCKVKSKGGAHKFKKVRHDITTMTRRIKSTPKQ